MQITVGQYVYIDFHGVIDGVIGTYQLVSQYLTQYFP